MSWTDERIEVLRKLWAEGLSASQIASSLGGVSRNAVIGKVHRLGLSGRVKAPQARAARHRARLAPARASAVSAVVASSRPATAGALALKLEEEAAPQVHAEVLSWSVGVALPDLSPRSCRWPLGDPSDPGFRYCGSRTCDGEVYCRGHAEAAYPARRRAG
ncbi:GcrA family cell cycle regulator [Acuticoccus sp.]|uniref:GcrA family cell cycle regulator n=1 Tax=Acuticoccus sp. TaxID=1904378 RepID=UPI003B52C09D